MSDFDITYPEPPVGGSDYYQVCGDPTCNSFVCAASRAAVAPVLTRAFAAEDKLALAEVQLAELKAALADTSTRYALALRVVDAARAFVANYPWPSGPLSKRVQEYDAAGPLTAPASTVEPERPEPVHDQGERSTTRILGTTDGQTIEPTTEDETR